MASTPPHSKQRTNSSESLQRRFAHKRIDSTRVKSRDQVQDGAVSTQSRQRKRTEHVEDVERIHVPPVGHEPTHPAFRTRVEFDNLSRRRVETFTFAHGVALDAVEDGKQRRERVGELQDTDCGDHAGETGEVGDARGDHKGYGPVDWDHGDPCNLAGFGGQWWGGEYFDENVVVEH